MMYRCFGEKFFVRNRSRHTRTLMIATERNSRSARARDQTRAALAFQVPDAFVIRRWNLALLREFLF